MRFGELVMQLLEERGMTQIELARRSGLSRPHINRIIWGGIEYPSIENAFAIADALGVDVNVFRDCFVEGEGKCIKDDSTA